MEAHQALPQEKKRSNLYLLDSIAERQKPRNYELMCLKMDCTQIDSLKGIYFPPKTVNIQLALKGAVTER